MLKAISKLFAFLIAFINILFYYLWAATFYIGAAVSQIFNYLPVLSFVGSLFNFLAGIIGKILLYIWLGFDYIILFLRELVMPLFIWIFSFIKKTLLWVWSKVLWFIRLFIPECPSHKKYCLKFDKSISYSISLLDEIEKKNKVYEESIQKHYQMKLSELYSKDNIDLVKVYNKAYKSRRNSDMHKYNSLLNEIQVYELNILNNYHMSIDQHRMIVFRNKPSFSISTYPALQTQALHLSPVRDKAII